MCCLFSLESLVVLMGPSDSNADASGRSRTLDAFFARVLPER